MNSQSVTAQGHSLQSRLLTMVLGLVMLVWAVTLAATWLDTEHEVGELLDAHLSQAAALLVSQPLENLSDIDVTETPSLHEYQPKVVFQVWHLDDLVIRSGTAPAVPMTAAKTTGFTESMVGGKAWRVFTTQGKDDHVLIHVGEETAARNDVVLASMRSVIWPMAMALPILALGVWGAVRNAVKPLRELGWQVAHRRPGQQDPLATLNVPLETQPLVEELNRLFERMAERLESERRFTADAAHELRTPISAIRMQAQVAQGASEPSERDEALQGTLTGCDRATHLVEQLLQLARLESDTDGITHGNSSKLQDCVRRVKHDLQATARARKQLIDVEWLAQGEELHCLTPDALTQVLVRNLIDNALRYSPDGGAVHVRFSSGNAAKSAFTIEDNGPGLDQDQMARLGERFFRVLGSGQSGSGLGWSIVTRIARLYGMQVTVTRSQTLGGLRVEVSWSRQQQQGPDRTQ